MWKVDIHKGLFSNECVQSLGVFGTEDSAFRALREFAVVRGFDMFYYRILLDPKDKQVQWIDFGSWSFFARIEETDKEGVDNGRIY